MNDKGCMYVVLSLLHVDVCTYVRVSVLVLGDHLWPSPGLHDLTGVLKIDITGFIAM